MKVPFALDRSHLQGIDESVTDQHIVREWIARAFASAPLSDPLSHLMATSVIDQIDAAGESDSFELSPMQFLATQLALVRATVEGTMSRIYVQLLNKFGISLPPHV